jgi:hypothetical protein
MPKTQEPALPAPEAPSTPPAPAPDERPVQDLGALMMQLADPENLKVGDKMKSFFLTEWPVYWKAFQNLQGKVNELYAEMRAAREVREPGLED